MSNTFLDECSNFSIIWQCHFVIESTLKVNVSHFLWASYKHCQKMMIYLSCPYQYWRNHFVPYCKGIYGKGSKLSNMLVLTLVLWKMVWKLLFSIQLTSINKYFQKMVEVQLVMQNLREKVQSVLQMDSYMPSDNMKHLVNCNKKI